MTTTELIARGDFAHASLRMATAAYLARFKGQSRIHTESDLRAFLAWCDRQGLDPIETRRPHIELYLRWMQEVVGYKPSTVSRRLSVVAGFYRTCVIDGVLEHSPAEYVRRPRVSAESPTLGLNHLQFEAILTASRESSNVNDFAWSPCSGFSDSASSRPPGPTSAAFTRSTDTVSCECTAKATRSPSLPYRQQSAEPSTGRSRTASTARSSAVEPGVEWTGTAPLAVSAHSQEPRD